MQQAAALTVPSSSPLLSRNPIIFSKSPPKLGIFSKSTPNVGSRCVSIKADAEAVNYSSPISVFPAEACETIGGESCLADIYPEVKLQPEVAEKQIASEAIDREYLEYNDPKTVLLDEACDVLGGEFCEGSYQKGRESAN